MSISQIRTCNNTDINNTEFNNTDPFFSSDFSGREYDGIGEFNRYYEYFYEELEIENLKHDFQFDEEILDMHYSVWLLIFLKGVDANEAGIG